MPFSNLQAICCIAVLMGSSGFGWSSYLHRKICIAEVHSNNAGTSVTTRPGIGADHRYRYSLLLELMCNIISYHNTPLHQLCLSTNLELQFLGHLLSATGVLPLPNKVTLIQNYPLPNIILGLQLFPDAVNYYGPDDLLHSRHLVAHTCAFSRLTELLNSTRSETLHAPFWQQQHSWHNL